MRESLWRRAERYGSAVTRDECEALHRHAKNSRGEIVELGSFRGRSALILADAAAPRSIHCVDMWAPYTNYKGVHVNNDFEPFLQMLRNEGIEEACIVHRCQTVDAGGGWDGAPVGFLFIDADHTWRGVLDDFYSWVNNLTHDATIAFHDYTLSGAGVKLAVDQMISMGAIEEVERTGSLFIARMA